MTSSPSPHKRPRLSSPTYEDEFDVLDGEDFRTLDGIEHELSQRFSFSSTTKNNLGDITFDDNASAVVSSGSTSDVTCEQVLPAKKLVSEQPSPNKHSMRQHLFDDNQPSSLEALPERNYETWFMPSKESLPAVFASASVLVKEKAPNKEENITESSDRTECLQTSWTIPRPDSVQLAKKRLHAWEQESENEEESESVKPTVLTQPSSVDRKPFRNVQNSSLNQNARSPPRQSAPPSTSEENCFINTIVSRTSAASSILPSFSSYVSSSATPTKLPNQNSQAHPLSSQKRKSLGLTPHSRVFSPRTKFKTPFKAQSSADFKKLKPAFDTDQVSHSTAPDLRSIVPSVSPTSLQTCATLNDTSNGIKSATTRPTLATCGLVPQTYDCEELDAMGVPSSLFTLRDITDFLYYRFNTTPSDPPTESTLDTGSALKELQRKACHLATKAWVDNNWCLVLWKLSGMVCLDPERLTTIWCWREVMRQLQYRYEKELAGGSRPALSMITARDTSFKRPLVLCVTKISWLSQDPNSNQVAQSENAHPELELTDGWYRIRAKVDAPLARATRRNMIRTGCKLICICSGLETPKNEPIDILDSYGRACLSLNGNSTHLAPWHTKLGFLQTRCVATLHSLSADGGRVPVMDFVVINVYPMGYFEFIATVDGDIRVGPRNESDEAIEEETWKNKRAREASRLHEELQQKLEKLESYADILERRANIVLPLPELDSAPVDLESIVDDLEECDNAVPILQNIDKANAGWLSLFLRRRCLTNREQANALIESELEALVPPRHVVSFRILRVKDARTLKRAPTRTAQLTVWDAAALQANSSSGMKPGQRYLVSNLMPTQHNAWMRTTEPGAEAFLSAGKDSKWQLIH